MSEHKLLSIKRIGGLLIIFFLVVFVIFLIYSQLIIPKKGLDNLTFLSGIRPLLIGGHYYNPLNGQKLKVDRSQAHKCCGQASYTFYEDEKWNIYWASYYQATLGSKKGGWSEPFKLPR